MNAIARELKFAMRDRAVCLWLVVVASLSALSVSFGLVEVERQHAEIQTLIDADQRERIGEIEKQQDWGSAAYYIFHFTYDPPSRFAFAAMGQRDAQPWKHRIRMLALEGQIYERDVGNPSLALIGRLDFAFFAAFIIPLVLIMLLYDLRSSEKTAGRLELLEASAGRPQSFWLLRAALRAGLLFVCLVVPIIAAAVVAGTAPGTLMLAILWVFAYIVFWTAVCFFVAAWRRPSAIILTTLMSIWVFAAVIFPAGARLAVDQLVPLPSGADILLLQRETVNDAWDLPRETTMKAFFGRHPEWANYQPIDGSFEWQWYYAFQRMGDVQTENLSEDYRQGRLDRARIAAWVSLLAPPSLLENSLQTLAKTDLISSIAYEDKVRAYHADLQAYYYPRFFRNAPFDKALLSDLPMFEFVQ